MPVARHEVTVALAALFVAAFGIAVLFASLADAARTPAACARACAPHGGMLFWDEVDNKRSCDCREE